MTTSHVMITAGGGAGGAITPSGQEYTAVLHFRAGSDEEAAQMIRSIHVDRATYDVRSGYLANDSDWHDAPWVCGGGYGSLYRIELPA